MKKHLFFFSVILTLQVFAQDQTINGTTFKHNGKVGIDITNPHEKLHVNGLVKIAQANNQDNDSPGIVLVSNDDFLYDGKYLNHYGLGFHDFGDATNTQRPTPYISGYFGIDFFSGGQNRLRILSNGNIGIGTTSPTVKLDVNGNLNITTPGGNWITGKTGNGGITSSTQLTSGAYHSLLRQTTTNGHAISLGGLGDYFGFFGYDKDRTSNGYDHNLIMNLNTGNIGIGNTNPQEKLELKGKMYLNSDTGEDAIYWSQHYLTMGTRPDIYSHNVLSLKPGGSSSGLLHSRLDMYVANSKSSYENKVRIHTSGDSFFNGGNVGIGTTNTQGFKLGVDGRIAATEVKVATYPNWPDFVFENNYNLPTLKEVEKQIIEKGHLKNIPSAKEVKKEGFFLGEMNSKLLQKIEELMLYTIEQNKQIEELTKRVKQLENK